MEAFNRLFVSETRNAPETTARHIMALVAESPIRLKTSLDQIVRFLSLYAFGNFVESFEEDFLK